MRISEPDGGGGSGGGGGEGEDCWAVGVIGGWRLSVYPRAGTSPIARSHHFAARTGRPHPRARLTRQGGGASLIRRGSRGLRERGGVAPGFRTDVGCC